MSATFGLCEEQLELAMKKYEKQRKFVDGSYTDDGRPFVDMLYSANLNPKRYAAEKFNIVKAHYRYAKEHGLMAVFLTITLPTEYHPCLSDGRPNPRYKGYTVADGLKELSHKWHVFCQNYMIQRIRKRGLFVYDRVVEPMKSGVPHYHVMMYMPKECVIPMKLKVLSNFEGFIDYKYTFYNGEKGVISYFLKYIFKTFRHSKTGEMPLCAYWYIYYSVRRFYTSRNLPALKHFRKCQYDERFRDYYSFTQEFRSGMLHIYHDKIYYWDFEMYDDVFEDLIFMSTKKKPPRLKFIINKKKEYVLYSPDYADFEISANGVFWPLEKPFTRMTNLDLIEEYKAFSAVYNPFDTYDMQRFNVMNAEYKRRFTPAEPKKPTL